MSDNHNDRSAKVGFAAASAEGSGQQPLYSDFADDPVMMELVELFVSELPQRLEAIEQALAQSDAAAVAKLSHQLKGAGGGYGFAQITERAAVVEKHAKACSDWEAIRQSTAALIRLCRRATSNPKQGGNG